MEGCGRSHRYNRRAITRGKALTPPVGRAQPVSSCLAAAPGGMEPHLRATGWLFVLTCTITWKETVWPEFYTPDITHEAPWVCSCFISRPPSAHPQFGSLGALITSPQAFLMHCILSLLSPPISWFGVSCSEYSVFAFLRSSLETFYCDLTAPGVDAAWSPNTLLSAPWRVSCPRWVALSSAHMASCLEHIITVV